MAPPTVMADTIATRRRARVRFTSNIVGGISIVADALALLSGWGAGLLLSAYGGGSTSGEAMYSGLVLIIGINFYLLRLTHDAYNSPLGRRPDADIGVVLDFLLAVVLVTVTVWTLGNAAAIPMRLFGLFLMSTGVILLVSRLVIRVIVHWLVRSERIGQRVVLYGADSDTAGQALRRLELENLPHLTVIGVADERNTRVDTVIAGQPLLGGFNAIIDLARRGEVDQVIIATPKVSQERLDFFVDRLSNVAVDVCLMPTEALRLQADFRVQFIGSTPMFYLWRRPMRDFHGLSKRLEDLAITIPALIVLSPLLLIIALLVKFTSPGPILFKQRRFGFNNEPVHVFKFRSMYINRQDVTGAARTTKRDPRVTPIGRFIRRSSIDELPQLFNVLRGEMSIVGPRPHAVEMRVGDKYYGDAVKGYAARHRVKPGITGLAQVRGLRGEIDTEERARKRIEYDLYYINNWSVAFDLRIIAETVFRIAVDKNAY
ncbi:undecaprenyl-phosphate glucose phosphotransferase [Sphingomonas sp. ID0503]|uniref:undecaprenyl-phosphate glucose phosphotransferase n=1 Tax=Sphingomonas sp. ID0503 TaxID=3399691 RepID=UPI003AFB0385